MPSSYLFLNDIRVHYLHWNLDGGGQPLILLHGLASNARIWELVAENLVQHDLAVLAPDLRGHGLTDKPDGDYDFDPFVRDLAAFREANNLVRPVLVGHSWGAMLALAYAARFSFGPYAPAGIILVDGGVAQLDSLPDASWEKVRERLAPPKLAGTRLSDFLAYLNDPRRPWTPDDRALPLILANFEIVEEPVGSGDRDGMDALPKGPAPHADHQARGETGARRNGARGGNDRGTAEEGLIYPRLSYAHHMQILKAMWDFKTYQVYSQIGCPVLAVPAKPSKPATQLEKDHLAVKMDGIARAEKAIANFRVEWMVDTIHDIPLQRPADLARLVAGFTAGLNPA